MSEKTDAAIKRAAIQWNLAPHHVKALAGVYVVPLLEVLVALNAELAEQWVFVEELAANNNRIVEAIFKGAEKENEAANDGN